MHIDVKVKDGLVELLSAENGRELRAVLKLDPHEHEQEYYMDIKETLLFYGIDYSRIDSFTVTAEDREVREAVCAAIRGIIGAVSDRGRKS